jgi:hypothetical protein
MSMGLYAIDSPVHRGSRASPGASCLGEHSQNTSWSSATGHWCSATSTLWSRSLFRTAYEQPARDSTAGRGLLSAQHGLSLPRVIDIWLSFAVLRNYLTPALGLESSASAINPCILQS